MRFLNCLLLFLLLFIFACEDETTDPNDPMFGSENEEKGLEIDFTDVQQTVHHFGGSDGWSAETIGENWPTADREAIAELLFSQEFEADGTPKGIGLSMWRTNIGAGSANQANNGFRADAWHRATECPLQPDGTYDWTQGVGTRWFMRQAKDYGVPYLTGWVTSPPYFMTKTGYTFQVPGNGGYNLQADKYDDFAAYLSEYLQYHADQGLNIDFLSPLNEPQYAWSSTPGESTQEGSPASNAEVAQVVREINTRLEADNVTDTKLIIPESGDIAVLYESRNSPNTSDQIREFWGSGSNQVGNLSTVSNTVAGHSYWTNTTPNVGINHRKDLKRAMDQFGTEFWQTEYSILGADYQAGRDVSTLTEIDYSLWAARIIHWDMVYANATGWSWWTSMSYPRFADHRFRFGLLNWFPDSENRNNSAGTYETSKNFWMFGNFSRFIRPGYQRVSVDNSLFSSDNLEAENVMASAYVSPSQDELVIVLINYSDEIVDIPLLKYGEEDGFTVVGNTFDSYTTDRTRGLAKGTVSATDITIGRKSIVTLVGEL
ncbi:MAG: glycoside hydrolase [Bacteroidota bacterium]